MIRVSEGHLQAMPAKLANHRPGELGYEHSGSECQQRAEDHQQQNRDGQDRQVLAELEGSLAGLGGVGLSGRRAGQVGLQVPGEITILDDVPEPGY